MPSPAEKVTGQNKSSQLSDDDVLVWKTKFEVYLNNQSQNSNVFAIRCAEKYAKIVKEVECAKLTPVSTRTDSQKHKAHRAQKAQRHRDFRP